MEVDVVELPVFELDENIGIPENFIPDIESRLQIYQEISLVYQISNLEHLKETYEDRFGKLPEPFLNLFKYQQIKILAFNIGVKNLNLNGKNCAIKFDFEVFGLTNLIKKLIEYDVKINGNNIRIFGGINIDELYDFLNKIYELKSNLITN